MPRPLLAASGPTRFLVVAAAAAALSACGPPVASLTTDRSEYTGGDTVILTLRNDGVFSFQSGDLSGAVLSQLRSDGSSFVVEDGFSLLSLIELDPGDAQEREEWLKPELPPGRYRYTHSVGDPEGPEFLVATEPFSLRAAGPTQP